MAVNLALLVGSDSNGSGVVALLENTRLFSLLHSNPNTRGRYNLIFGLKSGGSYNYNGTQKVCSSLDFISTLFSAVTHSICEKVLIMLSA